jgi:hypothetical protein
MHPNTNRAVALGFNTRSEMANDPTAATIEKSMMEISNSQFLFASERV